MRARVVKPKWIAGVMCHGYKGAFEMAAPVDSRFAFAATAWAVEDHRFDAVYDAFVEDETVQAFLAEHYFQAGRDIAACLLEAQDRELWRPKRSCAYQHLKTLSGGASVGDEEGW